MKKFPIEYNKTDLLADINDSFEKLSNNELLNTGAKNNLITRIQIAQLQLTSIQNKETTQKLSTILESSNSSSRNTVILSILMIILALITIFQSAFSTSPNYSGELKKQTEILESIETKVGTFEVTSDSTSSQLHRITEELKKLKK